MSRLKRKLLLYFLLIAIVSISVSAEIIFEMSTSSFQEKILTNFYSQLDDRVSPDKIKEIKKSIKTDIVFSSLHNFRIRMILLLLVVSGSIIGAFFLFTKDIVSPMDKMVEATKQIAGGDLTVTVPIMSEDEIGQVAGLINDMNINLQDMIMQIRQEINRHMEQIIKASFKISEMIRDDITDKAMKERKLRASDFKKIMKFGREVVDILETMSDELFALQKFVKMYKTYGAHSEISQTEIDKAMESLSLDGIEGLKE
jgi:methyl-accepting chemotaxis protein